MDDPSTATPNSGVCQASICLPNPHLSLDDSHFLYHLGLSSETTDFKKSFGDVKFVCVGGTANRMEEFARYLATELNLPDDVTSMLMALGHKTERYSLFKVGPVLVASHGIGVPSLSVLLHELFKLLMLASCSDVIFVRIGTCGGVGVDEGTVVVSQSALDGQLRPVYTWHSLGEAMERPVVVDVELAREVQACAAMERPVVVDVELAREVQACADMGDHFPTILGTTLCTDDFYEGQARLDGALCTISSEAKQGFMQKLWDLGVRNIEMESAGFLALCHAVGIKAVVMCVCLVNRLKADNPQNNNRLLAEFQTRPQVLAARFIKSRLAGTRAL